MAEAIGLAASILAVAQTAWTVAKGLHDLADEVGSAGEAVRIFANDFSLFVENLKRLGELLDDLPPTSRQVESATEDLLGVALDQVVMPFQALLHDLKPLLVTWHDSPSRMRQLGVRLQWAFSYKSKVLFFHGALNALKNNVSLLLQTMALKGQHQPHIRFILCGSIESTKAVLLDSIRRPTPRLLQSGQVVVADSRMIMATPASFATSLAVIDPALERRRARYRDPHEAGLGIVVVADADDKDEASFASASDAFAGIALLADEIPEDMEDDREKQSEFEGAIRTVQRKIFKLADGEVAKSAPSSDRLESSSVHSATADRNVTNEAGSTILADQSTRPTRSQVEAPQGNQQVIQFTDTLGNNFEIPYSSICTWRALKAFIMTEYRELKTDIDDIWILEDSVRKEAPRLAGYDEPLYKAGKLPKRIPPELLATLSGLFKILAAIQEERFTIFYRVPPSEQKQMVLPKAWESSVQPGWLVELVFDERELNELKSRLPPSHRRRRCALMAALDPPSDSLAVKAPASNRGSRSVSPGRSLSPSDDDGKSHKRSLSRLMDRLGVSSD